MTLACLPDPVCLVSDQPFAFTANVFTGDAYASTPLPLSSGDAWIDTPGLGSAALPSAVSPSGVTASFTPALLAARLGASRVAIRWVDENGSPGQLQFDLLVEPGLSTQASGQAASGQAANVFIATACARVVMYPAGPSGASATNLVALSSAVQQALAGLGVEGAETADDALLGLIHLIAGGSGSLDFTDPANASLAGH